MDSCSRSQVDATLRRFWAARVVQIEKTGDDAWANTLEEFWIGLRRFQPEVIQEACRRLWRKNHRDLPNEDTIRNAIERVLDEQKRARVGAMERTAQAEAEGLHYRTNATAGMPELVRLQRQTLAAGDIQAHLEHLEEGIRRYIPADSDSPGPSRDELLAALPSLRERLLQRGLSHQHRPAKGP